jgi:DNA polymerase-1
MTVRALHIDGSFLAYSRYKAHPEGVTARFMRRMGELQAAHSPRATVVSWDTLSGTLKRRQLHADYKAGRGEKEAGYLEELAKLRGELGAQGIVQASSPTGEADDVIATLVRTTPGPHVIYSADKDLLQLVGPGVTLIKAAVNKRYGADLEVTHRALTKEKMRLKLGSTWVEGLDAKGWGDLLALAGDAADRIPGIKGIGPGYALRMLHACPELVDLVLREEDDRARAAVAAKEPRLVRYVTRCCACREELQISRDLVTLQTLDDIETW